MPSKEENEYLCRTGPGTPMGNLLRHYWLPVILASEIPEADCPPVRIRGARATTGPSTNANWNVHEWTLES